MEKRFYSHGEKGLQLVTLFEIVDLTLHALPGKICISCLQMRIMRRSIERPCQKKEKQVARPKDENVMRKHFKLTEETERILTERYMQEADL